MMQQRHGAHTQADAELKDFLAKEIERERAESQPTSPPALKEWTLEKTGANLVLKRSFENEQIVVRLNVNNAIEEDAEAQEPPQSQENDDEPPPPPTLLCRPAFEVELKRGALTLAFNCTMSDPNASDDEQDDESGEQPPDKQQQHPMVDLFDIDEFSCYEGETMGQDDYVVGGDVMDAEMYEHLMNMLDDRGIGPEFMQQLTELATYYEHQQYVDLLGKLQRAVQS